MSGGSLDYGQDKIDYIVERILMHSRKPLHVAFAKHLTKVGKAVHDLEWVLSCDTSEGDEVEAIKAVIQPEDVLLHLIEEGTTLCDDLELAIEEARAFAGKTAVTHEKNQASGWNENGTARRGGPRRKARNASRGSEATER